MKKAIIVLILAVAAATAAFAQKVGDTVQVNGETYLMEQITGDTILLRKAQTASTFTLTGIPSQYNGKYAFLQCLTASGATVYGVQSFSTTSFTLVRIQDGSATFPLFTNSGFSYTGTEAARAAIAIYNQATYRAGASASSLATARIDTVVFTNGRASKSWAEGVAVQ